MTRNKIIAIVGIVLVAVMLVFSGIEAGLANSKDSVVGEWSAPLSSVAGVKYTFNADGSAKRETPGEAAVNGTWSYSWFKVTLEFDGEEAVTYKCEDEKLSSDLGFLTKNVSDEREVATYVKFYSEGFFGYGEKGNFKYWSFAHFTPIILFAIAVYLIYHYRDAIRNWKHEENFRFIYAAVMLFVEMSYFWRLLYVGSSEPETVDLLDKLPLQVCEWTCILAVFMMMKKSRAIYPICFYVCFTIGIFPLLTPSVITSTGPAYYRYYQYWLEHILPPLAVFYMTFVHGFRPTKKGIISAVGFMLTLVVLALICNANIPGANYLYLAEGTTDGGGSIMDPIRDMVGGSTTALVILLSVVVIGIFFLAFYVHKWIIALSEKVKLKKEATAEEN